MKKSILFFITILCCVLGSAQVQLPKWEKGYLDIHHINTGRGSCAFLILPDGTNMMIDAGDFDNESFDAKYAPMFASNDSLSKSPASIIIFVDRKSVV